MISKRKAAFGKADTTKFLLACVFILLVFVPLARMFGNIRPSSIQKVFTAPTFPKLLSNSLVAAALSTGITVFLAYLLAQRIERTDMHCKELFRILFVLPMLIPSISHGMGLVILFGNNGLITRILHLDGGICGLWGIVTGSVLYAFPVAFLMLSDVMKYEDSSP